MFDGAAVKMFLPIFEALKKRYKVAQVENATDEQVDAALDRFDLECPDGEVMLVTAEINGKPIVAVINTPRGADVSKLLG